MKMHSPLKRHVFKGGISEMQQGVFSLVIVMLILGLVMSQVALPAPKEHDKMQAKLLAMTTASAIDALSIMDRGAVKINLKEEWDIRITKERVEFSHEDMKVGANILGNAKISSLESVENIHIGKEAGKPVEVSVND